MATVAMVGAAATMGGERGESDERGREAREQGGRHEAKGKRLLPTLL